VSILRNLNRRPIILAQRGNQPATTLVFPTLRGMPANHHDRHKNGSGVRFPALQ